MSAVLSDACKAAKHLVCYEGCDCSCHRARSLGREAVVLKAGREAHDPREMKSVLVTLATGRERRFATQGLAVDLEHEMLKVISHRGMQEAWIPMRLVTEVVIDYRLKGEEP